MSQELSVARASESVSYSLDTSKLPRSFDGLWEHILRVLGASLRNFHKQSGADALCSLDLTQWWDRSKQPTLLLAVYFSTDARASRDDLAAFEPALAGSGLAWSVDGVMKRPRTARPVLAIVDGELVQVWLRRPDGVVAYGLAFAEQVGWRRHVAEQAEPMDFLAEAGHAVCRLATPNPDERRRVERLKLVFAHSVATRIVQADGVIDDGEQQFLTERFPEQRLAELGVDGDARAAVLAEAEQQLAGLLGHHEKLGLLSTFYAACYADGRLEVRELRVLKEAAEVLGLDRSEVSAYLQRLW